MLIFVEIIFKGIVPDEYFIFKRRYPFAVQILLLWQQMTNYRKVWFQQFVIALGSYVATNSLW